MKILVTGGAGFIGSALVRHLIDETTHQVVVLDSLTYAGNLANLNGVFGERCEFQQVDICDPKALNETVQTFLPDAIMHLAAESHVDRSIDGPAQFIQTNILGTYHLLQASVPVFGLNPNFRFLHVSTDEVFGSLGPEGLFREDTAYAPRSPYSASKAASDHLARAWFSTFDLPVLVTNCSNNYGPFQFPEKLIPLVIQRCLEGATVPIYGDGTQVRDWLHVEDHVRGLLEVLLHGVPGETYNLGGESEKTNLEVVHAIMDALSERSDASLSALHGLIESVPDRPGHDRRYAMDITKISGDLGWRPQVSFADGIARTVDWYISNQAWCDGARKIYDGERIGLGG